MSNYIDESFPIKEFQDSLIDWFRREKRDLPWRRVKDPYSIWVSEIMLQQTKVDTVIPYFYRFMQKFPTVEALAAADEQEVLKAWEGLGYYSRARNLQSAVREVVEQYNGQVPNDPKTLGSLKGVGPYTKGAILSIAFDKPEPAVDGNVMRVFSRVFNIQEDIAKPKTRKTFEEVVRRVISVEDPSSFNQGIMEIGALVCKPKNPDCLLCPLRPFCKAFELGIENTLPVKTKGKTNKTEKYVVLLLKDEKNRILVQQRPEKGLLANLWVFPMISIEQLDEKAIPEKFLKEYGIEIDVQENITEVKHVFSHLTWELQAYSATFVSGQLKEPNVKFISKEELELYPFPVSHQKLLKFI